MSCPSEGTCLELTEDYAGRAVNASLPSLPVFGSRPWWPPPAVVGPKPGVSTTSASRRTKPAWSATGAATTSSPRGRGDDEYPWAGGRRTSRRRLRGRARRRRALRTARASGGRPRPAARPRGTPCASTSGARAAYPEGNNGSGHALRGPAQRPAAAVQTVTLTPVLGPEASLGSGSYRLQSGNATTACVAVDAPPAAPRAGLESALRRRVRGRTDPRRASSVTYGGAYRVNSHVDALYVPRGRLRGALVAQVAVAASATSARPAPARRGPRSRPSGRARVYRKGGLIPRPHQRQVRGHLGLHGRAGPGPWDPAPQKTWRRPCGRSTLAVRSSTTYGAAQPGRPHAAGEVHRVAPGAPTVRQRSRARGGRAHSEMETTSRTRPAAPRASCTSSRRGSARPRRTRSWSARARPGGYSSTVGAATSGFPAPRGARLDGLAGVQRRGRNARRTAGSTSSCATPRRGDEGRLVDSRASAPPEVAGGPNPTNGYTWSVTSRARRGVAPPTRPLAASAQSANYDAGRGRQPQRRLRRDGLLENGRSVFEQIGSLFRSASTARLMLAYHGNGTLYNDRIGAWNRGRAKYRPGTRRGAPSRPPTRCRASNGPRRRPATGRAGDGRRPARGGAEKDWPTLAAVQDPTEATEKTNYLRNCTPRPASAPPVAVVREPDVRGDASGGRRRCSPSRSPRPGRHRRHLHADVRARRPSPHRLPGVDVGRRRVRRHGGGPRDAAREPGQRRPREDDEGDGCRRRERRDLRRRLDGRVRSQLGNVPPLIAVPALTGTGVRLAVETVAEGADPSVRAPRRASGRAGRLARIRAVNSEGTGQWTNEPARAKGGRRPPRARAPRRHVLFAAPASIRALPDLALAPASDSRVRVSYGEADARGLPVEAYLADDGVEPPSPRRRGRSRSRPGLSPPTAGAVVRLGGVVHDAPHGVARPRRAGGARPAGRRRDGVTRSATKNVATTVKLLRFVGDIDGVAVNGDPVDRPPADCNITGAVRNNTAVSVSYPANYGSLVVYTDADGNRDRSWRAGGGPDVRAPAAATRRPAGPGTRSRS